MGARKFRFMVYANVMALLIALVYSVGIDGMGLWWMLANFIGWTAFAATLDVLVNDDHDMMAIIEFKKDGRLHIRGNELKLLTNLKNIGLLLGALGRKYKTDDADEKGFVENGMTVLSVGFELGYSEFDNYIKAKDKEKMEKAGEENNKNVQKI